jgi:peptidoglycan/LPS O-acetylase OafA/YrhL
MGQARGDLLAGTTYVSNWFQIWVGQSYTAASNFAPLRHLWSLAVEEQFYLVWPVVMVVLLRKRGDHLPRVALWLVATSLFIAAVTAALYVNGTVFIGADPITNAPSCGAGESHGYLSLLGHCINVDETLYLGTFTRAGGLLLGAAFALVWRPVAIMRGPLRTKARRVDLLGLLGLLGLALMMNRLQLVDSLTNEYDPWLFRGGFLLTGICTLAIISAATHRRAWIGRLLGMRPLHWAGTRSYGMYLYHWPVYQIIREPGRPLSLLEFLTALLIALPITELSYRLIELPVRQGRFGEWLRGDRKPRTKAVLQRRRRNFVVGSAFAVLAGFATVSIATADVLCEGQVACDAELGSAKIAAGPVSAAPPTVTQPTIPVAHTVVPEATAPPATEPAPVTTQNPLDLLPPYAIGESVMLGAAPQLTAAGIQVNAAVSRQGTNVAEIVEMTRGGNQFGRVVIIQTGTNGSVSDETFARIMASLPPDLTPLVVFLTVKAPRGWIADNNARIRALPALYPNVAVVDWETEAQQIIGELSRSDGGVHLGTPHAKQFYANLIFDAIGRPDLKK